MKKLLTLCLLLFVFISCFGNAGVFRGILKIWQFNKKVTLASLSLHEIVLFILVAWTSISSIAAGKMTSVIGALTLAWLLLLAGGYGICKTVKAIKAEAKNEPV